MSNIVGSVLPSPAIKSTVRGLQNVQARTVAIGAPKSMRDLSDVDLSAVGDGALLILTATFKSIIFLLTDLLLDVVAKT